MHSEFRLTTALRHGSTKIDDIYFSAPFKLMHPFVNGRHAEYMLSFVGPGFLDGDVAKMECTFGPGTDATISTQSYEKVLNTKDGSASRTIDLTTLDDARAVFLPFPVIPFQNSSFSNAVTAHISPASTFVYADVVTNGRAGMGEQWRMRRYDSRVRIYVDEPAEHDGCTALGSSRAATDGVTGSDITGNDEQRPTSAAVTSSSISKQTESTARPVSRRRGRPRKPMPPTPRLSFAERLLLEPSRFDYTGMSLWRDYTHCGMMYIHLPEPGATSPSATSPDDVAPNTSYRFGATNPSTARPRAAQSSILSPNASVFNGTASTVSRRATREAGENALIDRLREFAEGQRFPGEFGATRVANGVVVRILTRRGDDAFDFIKAAADLATR